MRSRWRLHGLTIGIIVVGVVLTATVVLATRAVHDGNEHRLLRQRTREAASVLQAAIPGVQAPLQSAAEGVEAANGDPAAFQRVVGPSVGDGKTFVSASLWRLDDPSAPVSVIGEPPELAQLPPDQRTAYLERVKSAPTLSVLPLLQATDPRLGYGFSSTTGPANSVVYAEARVAPNRPQPVQPDNPFAGLDYAVYLGSHPDRSQVLLASVDPAHAPLAGRVESQTIPFGDMSLLLEMRSTGELGGPLLAALPWIFLALGLVLTVAAAFTSERLIRRRAEAERLAAENAELYRQQATVAETLQHSLLPSRLPYHEAVELAVRYQSGVDTLEVGGDWYDAMELDDGRLLLIIGDVSGRGLSAARVMGALRYSARAYATEGHDPGTILTKLATLVDVERDGHFATVLCAVLDPRTRTLELANAGHPDPLVVDDGGARFAGTAPGPPVGAVPGAIYRTAEVDAGNGSVLFFTDGLIERPGETIDLGLERLRDAAGGTAGEPLETMVSTVLEGLARAGSDDVAILGFRWRAPAIPEPTTT